MRKRFNFAHNPEVGGERQVGLSIRDLGPIAAGFAVIIMAGMMYQAISQVGGNWAGAGLALGASLLVASLLATNSRIDVGILRALAFLAMLVGVVVFLMHQRTHTMVASPRRAEPRVIQPEKRNLRQDHIVSDLLGHRLRDVDRQVDHLHEHPREAEDVLLQLRRMLPAEGWLTERLSRLRESAFRVRQGHIARIEEIQHLLKNLSPEEKRKAAEELAGRYKELNLDLRLDRLDKAVAVNERAIRDLTRQAEGYLAANDYRRLHGVLEAAQKLQKHNSHLFTLINGAEKRLSHLASNVAKKSIEVTDG